MMHFSAEARWDDAGDHPEAEIVSSHAASQSAFVTADTTRQKSYSSKVE
jgi:hypothetical protein